MSALTIVQTKRRRFFNMSTASAYTKKLDAIQKIKNKYGFSVGMQVTHAIYRSYGIGIIDGFETIHNQAAVRVEWANVSSSANPKDGNVAVHGPGILRKVDNLHDCKSNPNEGFRVHKHLINRGR